MLRWAVAFFIVAIVAAIFGFGDIAAAATGVAKILFYVFLILFLISLVSGITLRRRILTISSAVYLDFARRTSL